MPAAPPRRVPCGAAPCRAGCAPRRCGDRARRCNGRRRARRPARRTRSGRPQHEPALRVVGRLADRLLGVLARCREALAEPLAARALAQCGGIGRMAAHLASACTRSSSEASTATARRVAPGRAQSRRASGGRAARRPSSRGASAARRAGARPRRRAAGRGAPAAAKLAVRQRVGAHGAAAPAAGALDAGLPHACVPVIHRRDFGLRKRIGIDHDEAVLAAVAGGARHGVQRGIGRQDVGPRVSLLAEDDEVVPGALVMDIPDTQKSVCPFIVADALESGCRTRPDIHVGRHATPDQGSVRRRGKSRALHFYDEEDSSIEYGARNKVVGTVENIKRGVIMHRCRSRCPLSGFFNPC